METIELNTSWLNGKYTVNNHKVEINTALPYIAIDGARIDFFAQGDDAETFINQMHAYWLANDCTIEDAIQNFMSELY